MLCWWWCQSNSYQPYSSKTTKFSLIFEEKRGDGIEGEEYRRRISKRGGGREDCAAVIEELLEGTPIVDVIFVLLCLKSYCSIWNLLKKVGSLASSQLQLQLHTAATHKCMLARLRSRQCMYAICCLFEKALFASFSIPWLGKHTSLLNYISASSSLAAAVKSALHVY